MSKAETNTVNGKQELKENRLQKSKYFKIMINIGICVCEYITHIDYFKYMIYLKNKSKISTILGIHILKTLSLVSTN